MGRIFWFAVGVGLTVVLVVKGRELYERFTPKGVTEQVEKTSRRVRGRIEEFLDTMTSAMDEREAELREALGLAEETTLVQETPRT